MNLLLIEEGENTLQATDPRAHHIRKILQLGTGDTLQTGIINGSIGIATIVQMDSRDIKLEFTPQRIPEPLAPVSMILGHPRPIVLKRMLRDLCAIGIRSLFVVHTELGERSYFGSTLWEDIRGPLLEGASQGGSTLLTQVVRCHTLSSALESAASSRPGRSAGSSHHLVLHPSDGADPVPGLSTALSALAPNPLVLAVGSERGWTPGELDLFDSAGYARCGMGSRILRTESAATAAAWAAVSWLSDGRPVRGT